MAPSSCQATVVSRPCAEAIGVAPVLRRRKQPVRYVFLAEPASKQHWPKRAACWSPAIPVMGMPAGSSPAAVSPNTPAEGFTAGKTDIGTSNIRHSSSSAKGANVEAERARGVRRIRGVHGTARESPQEPRVDGAEGELAP